MDAIGSKADYARHIGVSRQAVSKMVMAGRIPVRDDGRIDFAEADLARAESTDPTRGGVTAAPGPAAPAESAAPQAGSLTAAKAEQARVAAETAQFKLDRERGLLLPRQEIEDAAVTAGRAIRTSLDALPALAAKLDAAARSGGEDAVRAVLKEEVRRIEETMVEQLARLVDADAG